MSNRQKALVYVLLAMLEPLGKELAVGVEKQAWPTPFALAATGCAMLYAGLLVLKAWSSDSSNAKSEVQEKSGESSGGI